MTVKKAKFLFMILILVLFISGCNTNTPEVFLGVENQTEVEITVFAAKSLNASLEEIIELYQQENPSVTVRTNYDSSGTLMTQILEGGAFCDIFLSAAEKQMDTLSKEGFLVEDTRTNLLKNQICVVTYKGGHTKVTGLKDLGNATSLAIGGESVPIGYYAREALVHTGIIKTPKGAADITAKELSEALNGVDINTCVNAGAVVASVVEQSNEVGIVYYSDTFGHEEELQILEMVPDDLTGEIQYPVAQVVNQEANNNEQIESKKFLQFLTTEKAKEVFEKYHFVVE